MESVGINDEDTKLELKFEVMYDADDREKIGGRLGRSCFCVCERERGEREGERESKREVWVVGGLSTS